MTPTKSDPLGDRDEAIMAAHFEELEAASTPCPHCKRGTVGPDSNGSYWRCHFCRGTGRIKKENA